MYLSYHGDVDTAAVYKNESLIGQALKDLCPKYGIHQREVFLTSKLGWFGDSVHSCVSIMTYIYTVEGVGIFLYI